MRNSLGFGKPPSSNTGVKCQNLESGLVVRVDWFQCVGEFSSFEQFRYCVDLVSSSLDDCVTWTIDRPVVHGIRFADSASSARGCCFAWNPPDPASGQMGKGWMSVCGSALSSASARDVWRMLCGLRHYDFRATRFDIALDDYTKRITPREVAAIACDRNFALASNYQVLLSGNRGHQRQGFTVYFGSKKSEKLTRYYDKEFESDGEIKSYRWELQLRDHRAHEAFCKYTDIESADWASTAAPMLGGFVAGGIDFVDRSSGARLSRLKRLDWWQGIIDEIGACIRTHAPKKVTSFIRKVSWFYRQVQTSFAIAEQVFGELEFGLWVRDFVRGGADRLSPKDLALIQVARIDWRIDSGESVLC